VRADDRQLAEQALSALRTKAETATGRIRVVEEEMAALRTRHAMELERISSELDTARARVDAVDVELSERREREEDLRHALAAAEARAVEAGSVRPTPAPPMESAERRRPAVRAPETAPTPAPKERVPVSVGASAERTPPPSDLRRAVFASLTELAGDAE